MNLSQKFNAIRTAYAMALPEWMAEYHKTGNMHHDPYLLDWDMSPIERNVWGDIRYLCLPFYPQVPALNYFLDFANPFLKIGIECDGKEWHEKNRDNYRDARLSDEGWTIFRLQGHECVRQVYIHIENSNDEISASDIERHYASTSEGLLKAIKSRYFDDSSKDFSMMRATLERHRTTPEKTLKRQGITKEDGPYLMADLLDEHWELMMRRAERARRQGQ